ncbi:MAG: phosphoenolpyruvate--protein phosphotransferase [Phycisphaerae bacterium]
MTTKKGINASPGVAIGPALVLDTEEFRIPRRTIDAAQTSAEVRRLESALEAARQEVSEIRVATKRKLGSDTAQIFAFHEAVIADPSLKKNVIAMIEQHQYTAAYAFSQEMNKRQREFLAVNDPYLKERVRDLYDIEKRVLRNILGRQREDVANLTQPVIIVAHDLTPSQAVSLDRSKILGYACDVGGSTSHTAIIARMQNIPAVLALTNISALVTGGETIILDGADGIVIIDPDEETIDKYRLIQARFREAEAKLAELRDKPAITTDDCTITLQANIELAEEARTAMESGAEGIGLYRSEFLYLQTDKAPTEEQQFEAFRAAVRHARGNPVTIRTMDLGADKMSSYLSPGDETNPALGLRSLRYCLSHLDMFKTHLRAILRASAEGKVRIMFPMLTTLVELRQARATVQDVMEDLEEEGLPFNRDLPIGMMVETPAAAMLSGAFSREAAFMSIGTNDLTQYALAADRGNERVAYLYAPHHPAVLRLIRDVIGSGKIADTDVSICGEMAGNPLYTELLVGLGLRTLSMAPQDIPEVKRTIRSTSIKRCERIAETVMTFDDERQVNTFLRDQLRQVDPEGL